MTDSGAGDQFHLDYRRHTAALDLLPEHQDDFQRLVKLLLYATGFQLLFVRIADAAYQNALIAKLDDLMAAKARPVRVVNLAAGNDFSEFDDLERWLEKEAQNQAVIHLINGGDWLKGTRVESLNLRRNALAEHIDAALIWWLPASAIERVALDAPDAWSWRGGVFDFIDAGRGALYTPLASNIAAQPRNSLTLSQRSQRLAVLQQQLKGEVPDDFRLNLLLERADLLESIGLWDDAERVLREQALPLTEKLGDERSQALTLGRTADIMYRRGDLDEALRIRREKEMPVYEKLDDEHSRAVTQGQIADILYDRGELDEALRIQSEDVVPTFERLGDMRGVLAARANLAIMLRGRRTPADLAEARTLLLAALADAQRLRIPEADTIQGLLNKLDAAAAANDSA